MIKNIFVGKADWGFCVDVQCNEEHEHDGSYCCCSNVGIFETQDEALKIGFLESLKHDVPMVTEWDKDESKLSCDIYTIDDYEDLLNMRSVIENNPIRKIYIRTVFEQDLYSFLEKKYGFVTINEDTGVFHSVYRKYDIRNWRSYNN